MDTFEEMIEIIRQLSPNNQAYLLTLARVAEAAENGLKENIKKQANLSDSDEFIKGLLREFEIK